MVSSKSKSTSRTKQLSSTRPTFPTSSSSHSPSTSASTSTSTSTSKPTSSSSATRKSSRTTQSIITIHHILNKRLHSAIAVHGEESPEVSEIRDEIERRGGLRVYQDASFTGQMGERGGDSSGVLVGWLREDESLRDWLGVGTTKARSGRKEGKQGKKREREREIRYGDGEGAVSETSAQGGRIRKRKRVDEDHDDRDESTTLSNDIINTPADTNPHSGPATEHHDHEPPTTLRILEIGALSPHNHLSTLQSPSTNPKVQIRRIDLRSTHPQIEQQDFMTLDPYEVWQGEIGYDVISLSLVLNFVGDARGRGEMLGWTRGFFRRRGGGEDGGAGAGGSKGGSLAVVQDTDENTENDEDNDNQDDDNTDAEDDNDSEGDDDNSAPEVAAAAPNNANQPLPSLLPLLPALFLVLPLPTLTNSRYLTEPHLTKIMASLGYTLTRVKRSSKVYYSLWRFEGENHSQMREGRDGGGGDGDGDGNDGDGGAAGVQKGKRFGKKELRGGRERNNFCIVLDG